MKIKIPRTIAWREPKVLVRLALGFLLAANLFALAIVLHVFDSSPEALNQQMAVALSQRQTEQAKLNRSRTLASSVDRGKTEGQGFLAGYMTSRRHTYSTIIGELTDIAKAAGMQKEGATIGLDAIEGSDDLDMMSISLNLEGDYAQLMKFVNLLDRSRRFLIIETLTATPRSKSDTLVVNVKLDTFVQEDKDGVS
jgi:hypothetical protein